MTLREAVLLVGEDDAFAMYAEYLAFQGLEAHARSSPAEALDALGQIQPSVIVSELVFRGGLAAGCEFLEAIRSDPSTREAIVIVVSGYVRSADAELARRYGADQFFVKPLLPEALSAAVRTALDSAREGRRPEWRGPTVATDRRQQRRRKT
jgi:CheY-like chemotaxis protein